MQLKAPLLPFLLKTDMIVGEVKRGRITIEDAIVKSDIPIELPQERATLAWTGSVSLQDRKILNFNTAIPKQLLADLPLLRNNQKFLPAVLNVPISGSFDAPKVDLVGAVTKSALPGLGSGKPEDLINNLPDILGGGGGKKDKEKDKSRDKPIGDQPIGREPRSANDARDRNANPTDDPIGGLVDLAGGLLGGDKNKDRGGEKREMRDATGDQRISSDPDAPRKPAATTGPTTKSGKTKAARAREQQQRQAEELDK
jgi:hypothetical protein